MSSGRLLRSSAVVDDIQDVDTWRCTDVLFLAIFSLFWAGLVIISLGAFATGDLTALEFGTDYLGNRCGQGKFADRPAVWYPRMSEDLGSQWMILHEHPSALVMYGLCLPECPRRPAAPIADYGYAEGHPGAKAAYWPVAMRARMVHKPQTQRWPHWSRGYILRTRGPFRLGSPRPSCSQRLLTPNVNALRAVYACHPGQRTMRSTTVCPRSRRTRRHAATASSPAATRQAKSARGWSACRTACGRCPHASSSRSARGKSTCAHRMRKRLRPRWASFFLGESMVCGLALGHCSRASDSGSPTDPTSLAPRARRHQQTYAKQPNTGPIIDYLLTIASTVNAAAE